LQASGFGAVASKRRGHPYYDLYALATKAPVAEADMMVLAKGHLPA